MYGAKFGLSGAMKKAEEETAKNKRVYEEEKEICNYVTVEYLTDARGIHRLSKLFYETIMKLPYEYKFDTYMDFIRTWGTVS